MPGCGRSGPAGQREPRTAPGTEGKLGVREALLTLLHCLPAERSSMWLPVPTCAEPRDTGVHQSPQGLGRTLAEGREGHPLPRR